MMALASYVLALGDLTDEVVDCLERPTRYYQDAPRGSLVCGRIFQCRTTTQSHNLARALRVNPEDPATYQFDPWRIRERKLEPALGADHFGFVDDLHIFRKLREAGFMFIFRPEP
jgi:hypothetical protein